MGVLEGGAGYGEGDDKERKEGNEEGDPPVTALKIGCVKDENVDEELDEETQDDESEELEIKIIH